MKTIRNLSSHLHAAANGGYLYIKDRRAARIPVFPANMARRQLSTGFHRTLRDDTDDIPIRILRDGHMIEPVVCAPPQISGNFLAGYIDRDRNILSLCEFPTKDPCQAARWAAVLARDPSADVLNHIPGEEEFAQ